MRKRLPIAVVTAGLAALTAVPALAAPADQTSGTVVSTDSVAAGTRQLEVLDLAGHDLTNLALKPGVAQSFRVSVVDDAISDLTKDRPFTVSAVMNNLYRATGANSYDYATTIPSSDVSIAFPQSGALSAFGVGLSDVPNVLLNGALPGCQSLTGILNLTLVDLTSLLQGLCGVGGVLTSGPLTLPSDLPVVSSLKGTLSGVADLGQLPFGLSSAGGAFTDADYQHGIGVADTGGAGAAGTPRTILAATKATDLSGILAALGYPTNLPLVSETGAGAMTSLSSLLNALSLDGLTNLVSTLAPLSTDQLLTLFNNGTVTGALSTTLQTLTGESGTYNAFPSLTVTPSDPQQAAGTYSGTMTITMVQQ